MKVSKMKYLVASLITALVLLSAIPAVSLAEAPSTTGGGEEVEANVSVNVNLTKVAEVMVSKITNLTGWVKATISEYNITLPEGLNRSLEKAEELLTNASGLISSNPRAAITDSLRAGNLLMPVVRYVAMSAPPEYMSKVRAADLLEAIRIKMRMVNDLNRTIAYLANRSVNVPPELVDELKEANQKLAQARSIILNEGNVSEAAKLMAEANKDIADVRVALVHGFKNVWRNALAADAALKHFGMSMRALTNLMDRALTELEANDTAHAEITLSILVNISGKAVDRLTTIAEKTNASKGPFGKVLNNTLYVAETINNASQHALQALKEGNSQLAVTILQDAMNRIKPVLNEMSLAATWIHRRIKWALDEVGRLRIKAEGIMHKGLWRFGKHPKFDIGMVERVKKDLMDLQHAYKAHWISCDTYKQALSDMQAKISNLLSNNTHIPPPIKIGLQNLLNAISNEISNLQCPAGNQGS